jgi:diaminohydroxyphosphoribosylaminopyrimidine deaminase/5-amino-6-(5-phosphoribosylamino)uracil reductase
LHRARSLPARGRSWLDQTRGRPHAETEALAQAGEQARGGTVYVTLEPCAHHGQTPPCAEALVAAGITRVVSAAEDLMRGCQDAVSICCARPTLPSQRISARKKAEEFNFGFFYETAATAADGDA